MSRQLWLVLIRLMSKLFGKHWAACALCNYRSQTFLSMAPISSASADLAIAIHPNKEKGFTLLCSSMESSILLMHSCPLFSSKIFMRFWLDFDRKFHLRCFRCYDGNTNNFLPWDCIQMLKNVVFQSCALMKGVTNFSIIVALKQPNFVKVKKCVDSWAWKRKWSAENSVKQPDGISTNGFSIYVRLHGGFASIFFVGGKAVVLSLFQFFLCPLSSSCCFFDEIFWVTVNGIFSAVIELIVVNELWQKEIQQRSRHRRLNLGRCPVWSKNDARVRQSTAFSASRASWTFRGTADCRWPIRPLIGQ